MKTKTDIFNILFCGTGGQGVLKASEVAGVAAVKSGYHVKKSEVHGMAQRGGSVESHLRFGEVVHSPLIMPQSVDILVAFHEGEAKRLRGFLKPGGLDLSPYLSKTKELPDARFTNTFFLGMLASQLPLSIDVWYEALTEVVAKRIDENKDVFNIGLELGKNLK